MGARGGNGRCGRRVAVPDDRGTWSPTAVAGVNLVGVVAAA